MRVLITGAEGFIGQNLQSRLAERSDIQLICFGRSDEPEVLRPLLNGADFVIHLAGVNRPVDPQDFHAVNHGLTQTLCDGLSEIAQFSNRKIPVIYASSTQATNINPYGQSKKAAEDALFSMQRERGVPVHVFRLPNIFGKWCKPNYNSVVATFCYNLTRGLPIEINDPNASLNLVYIDDLVETFIALMLEPEFSTKVISRPAHFLEVGPTYTTTVGELASVLNNFVQSRNTLITPPVGIGLTRALYSTFISYIPPEGFTYVVPRHEDARGVFVEMLKTESSGQFSYFTAHPGITRGGHYHHSKSEKFLVIKGEARFKFRHLLTGQTHELETHGDSPRVVDTVPGWTHDITNIGESELVVMLWANEVFDPSRPDTIACPV